MNDKFEVGTAVRYAEKWCSPGERKYIHIIREAYKARNENDKCILIETINSDCFWNPTEWVTEAMIEKLEH